MSQTDEFAYLQEVLKARVESGLTQAEVAERMGTTQSAIARLESPEAKHSPSIATLQKYARSLGYTVHVRLVKEVRAIRAARGSSMNPISEDHHRALKRMLANGPLTAVPKRPSDQRLLVALAAARFDAGRTYREAEVNETLKGWLGTFCAPYGIDHVTMRRMLVDSRLLARTRSGSTYRVDREKVGDAPEAPLEPAEVLAEVRAERESRKRRRPE